MCKNKKYRLSSHKNKYNTCISKQIINRNNYEYIILEDILDIDKKELRIKEQEYIDKYNCINKNKAYVTEEHMKEYMKEYNKTNKEYMKQYYEKYYINNKEQIKQYDKERHFFKKYNDVIADYINQINQY